MTKKDLAKAIADRLKVNQLLVLEIIQSTFEGIIDTLVREGRLELRNFGVFEVKKREARLARNPRTGQRVQVPPRFVVTFKPGREMELRVAQLTALPHKRRRRRRTPPSGGTAAPARDGGQASSGSPAPTEQGAYDR